ncbi:hypothetical protein MKW94_022582, partial [Papaver nudicaule]|nr:hypothetical protein [Papaver nudicaule]
MEVPNDQHAVNHNNVPSSCIIEWTIENVSTLNEENHFSPIVTIGPHKWQLLAFRRGSNVDDYLSVYVVAVECTNSRYAKFSLSIVGQTDKTFKKEGSMLQFTEDENDWGFDDFIKFKELIDPSNGYIIDDVCTIEAELYLNSTQDSVEELVPMELIESVEERDPGTNCTLQASTSVCPDNNSAFTCAFCQTFKVSEVSGSMLHITNGKEVEEGEASGPNVIHVHQKCIE